MGPTEAGPADATRPPTTAADVARELTDEVADLPSGTRLPSEHALMRRYGVTRSVVRAAVDTLVARHQVRRVHGAGMFAHRRIDYVVSSRHPPSLHATVAAGGGTARTFLVDVDDVHPPPSVSARLARDPGETATRLVRIAYVDGTIATCTEEWIAGGLLGHADLDVTAVESLYEVLRMRGHTPVRARCRAATELPPAEVAERLDLDGVTATWQIETLTTDASTGLPLMFSRGWMRQDVIRVVFEFDGDHGNLSHQ